MASITSPSGNYLQSLLSNALQSTGLTTKTPAGHPRSSSISSAQPPDSSQLSPFARLVSSLQQFQESDPAKYQQLTGEIATNLQNAAQTAQDDGNSTAARQLNQLATDFTNASNSGQLPNIQDLAQAIGGHHHRHQPAASTDTNGNSNGTNGGTSTTQSPFTIILNTLTNGSSE